jgi:hypothetical protein
VPSLQIEEKEADPALDSLAMIPEFQAGLVFTLFVVPGFLLIRGYTRGRTHAVPPISLYALAEAVVASLFLLLIAWWPAHLAHFMDWAHSNRLVPDHETQAYNVFAVLVLTPYPLGRVAGGLLDAVARRPSSKLARMLTRLRILGPPTVWDAAWSLLHDEGRAWVVIRTKGGKEIVGIFAKNSRIGTSPLERQVYLEQEYGMTPEGFGIISDKGVYVDAAAIESAHFKRIVERPATAEPTRAASAAGQ